MHIHEKFYISESRIVNTTWGVKGLTKKALRSIIRKIVFCLLFLASVAVGLASLLQVVDFWKRVN